MSFEQNERLENPKTNDSKLVEIILMETITPFAGPSITTEHSWLGVQRFIGQELCFEVPYPFNEDDRLLRLWLERGVIIHELEKGIILHEFNLSSEAGTHNRFADRLWTMGNFIDRVGGQPGPSYRIRTERLTVGTTDKGSLIFDVLAEYQATETVICTVAKTYVIRGAQLPEKFMKGGI